ncbi:MAG: hypothetical protein QOJ46_2021 [bacterium]|jgi:hypothetical protein
MLLGLIAGAAAFPLLRAARISMAAAGSTTRSAVRAARHSSQVSLGLRDPVGRNTKIDAFVDLRILRLGTGEAVACGT